MLRNMGWGVSSKFITILLSFDRKMVGYINPFQLYIRQKVTISYFQCGSIITNFVTNGEKCREYSLFVRCTPIITTYWRQVIVYSLRKEGDNTPPTSDYILLMPWLIRVTTKQEICFLMYTYISTILLLEEYAWFRLDLGSYLRDDDRPARARLGSARGFSSSPSRWRSSSSCVSEQRVVK